MEFVESAGVCGVTGGVTTTGVGGSVGGGVGVLLVALVLLLHISLTSH